MAPDVVIEDPIGPSYTNPDGLGVRGKEAVAALPDDLGHSLVFYLERQEGFAKQRVALLKLLQLCAPPTAFCANRLCAQAPLLAAP
jgi:hypothetical protein